MRLKYVGMNPICQEIYNSYPPDTNVGDTHPRCCRFPKSCSSGMYEFYPETDIEIPKKVKLGRTEGIGPRTPFDWYILGYHPKQKSTITLYKFFSSFDKAQEFLLSKKDWVQILIDEGLSKN